MGIVASFSIVGIIAAFLIGVLGSLPFSDSGSPGVTEPVNESSSIEAVHQAAGLFSNVYTSLIDEMISYQKDPDYRRAESRRQELAEVGESLADDFQEFEGRLRGILDELTFQGDDPDSGATE